MTEPVILHQNNQDDIEACPNLTEEILSDLYRYWPLSTMPETVKEKLIKTIYPAMDIKSESAGKGRARGTIGAYYSRKYKHIVLNMSVYGYVISGCKLIKKPNEKMFKFLSQIVAHELIHLICIEKYNDTLLDIYNKYGFQYYANFWYAIFKFKDNGYIDKLGRLHYNFALNDQIHNIKKDKFFGLYGKILDYNYNAGVHKLLNVINILKKKELPKIVQRNLSDFEKGFEISQGPVIWFPSSIQDALYSAYGAVFSSGSSFKLISAFGQEVFIMSEIFCMLTQLENKPVAKQIVETILAQY